MLMGHLQANSNVFKRCSECVRVLRKHFSVSYDTGLLILLLVWGDICSQRKSVVLLGAESRSVCRHAVNSSCR
jgi:hypothetical protein